MADATSYYDKNVYSKLYWIVVQFFQTEKKCQVVWVVNCLIITILLILMTKANFNKKKTVPNVILDFLLKLC